MAHIPVWELSVWVFAGVWALNGLYEVMSGGWGLGGLRYQLSTHSNHSPHVMAAITTHSSNALNTSWLLAGTFFRAFSSCLEGILLSNHEFNKTWQDCVISQSPHLSVEARVGCDISDMFCEDNEAPSTSFSTCPKWRFDVMTFCICANFMEILRHEIFAIFGKPLHCIFRVTQYFFSNSPPCSEVAPFWSEFRKYMM